MVNVAYVVDQQNRYDFVKCVKPGTKLVDFNCFGLGDYTIIITTHVTNSE